MASSISGQRTISGIVKNDENQERLPFADIVVQGTNQGTSTNVDGYFSLIDVPEEALVLQIHYVGYSYREITIDAGTVDIANLVITLSSGILLDELVVQGRSYKVMNASDGVSSIQISPAQLALLPNVGK